MADYDDIKTLLQPIGGLFCSTIRATAPSVESTLYTRVLPLGDVFQLRSLKCTSRADRRFYEGISGTGTELTDEQALFLAFVEGVERYSTCICWQEQFVSASGNELGSEALDLAVIPRCSDMELAKPNCPLRRPTKAEPIRWVRGLSLRNGRNVYLPAVMVYLGLGYTTYAERIALPITTGCAAHRTYEDALLHAICEVVERDALSLLWLQQLQLPRITVDQVSALLSPYLNGCQGRSRDIQYDFFNATTDVGVPTVYGIRLDKSSMPLRTIVACSSDINPDIAVAKVIRDLSSISMALRRPRKVPDSWEDFCGVLDGAKFMACSEQSEAFNFLFNTGSNALLSAMTPSPLKNDDQPLRCVLHNLFRAGHDVFAIDLSTDEAIRAGLRVVRAIIPGLQPLSFHYRARYLGHPRLYEAPKQMGYRVLDEKDINIWPQPFG